MGGRTKIDWCDSTISPVRGCSRGCEYCYARKMNARWKWVEDFGVPQFFPAALEQPYKWKGPRIIFVCSLGELFDPLVPTAWTHRVFAMMEDNPQHRFMVLTKCYEEMQDWFEVLPENMWMGFSVTDSRSMERSLALNELPYGRQRFLSIEPLLGPLWPDDKPGLCFGAYLPDHLSWIIIGAQTNPNVQPKRVWVQEILNAADDAGIPVLMKHNLEWPGKRRFEFPAELEKIRSNG